MRVDYSNYLEQQTQWAASLVQLAQSADQPDLARELGEVVAATLRRMICFSVYRRF